MEKIKLIKKALLTAIFFMMAINSNLHAQTGSGTSMAPILSDAVDYIKYIEDGLDLFIFVAKLSYYLSRPVC